MSNDKKKSYAQFRHYHGLEGGFGDVFSDKCTPEDKKIFAAIAASLQREDDSCFTYLPKGERVYLVQTTKTTDSFAHGLALTAEEAEGIFPADYIGQLEKDAIGREGETLENGTLPRAGAPVFSRAAELRPLFPRIVDALVYSEKPVILTGSKAQELILYVSIVLHMLPANFARRIGFSVCTESLPLFFGNAEHLIGSGLRLLATTARVGESARWTVINVDTATPADDRNLRPYARAIDALGGHLTTGGEGRIRAFLAGVKEAFPTDGSIRHELLNTLLLVSEFERLQTPESARTLLELAKEETESRINEQSLTSAAHILLDGATLSAEDGALIDALRESNAAFNELIGGRMGRLAFTQFVQGKPLSPRAKNDVLAFLDTQEDEALLPDGSLMAPLFVGPRAPETFRFLCEAWIGTNRDVFAILATRYVHISDTYNYKELHRVDFNRALFEIADSFGEYCTDVYGLTMLSCYLPAVVSNRAKRTTTEGRIEALVQHIRSLDRDSAPLYANLRAGEEKWKETIEFVRALLRVKGAVLIASNSLGEEVCTVDDFDFLPQKQLEKLVGGFSFEECLVLYTDAATATDRYTALRNLIKMKLLKLEDVKTYILPKSTLLPLYMSFMEENEELFTEGDEVRKYVEFLFLSGELNSRIAEYRSAFVIGSYNNLSASRRSKVAEQASRTLGHPYIVADGRDDVRDVLDSTESDMAEKQCLTETVISVTRENEKTRTASGTGQNNRFMLYTYLISLGYMLLAAIALLATPVITAFTLELPLLPRIAEFVGDGHIAAIVGVGALNILLYGFFWLTSKHDRLLSLLRAARLTFFLLLLPTLLYAAGFALTYFLL